MQHRMTYTNLCNEYFNYESARLDGTQEDNFLTFYNLTSSRCSIAMKRSNGLYLM